MFNVSHLCDKPQRYVYKNKTKQNTNKQTNKQAHKREFEFAAAASTILTDHYSLQAQGFFATVISELWQKTAFQQHRRRKPPLQVAPSQKTPLTVQLLKKSLKLSQKTPVPGRRAKKTGLLGQPPGYKTVLHPQ